MASAEFPGFCVAEAGRATVADGGTVDVTVRLRRTVVAVAVVRADDESRPLLGDVTLALEPVDDGAPLPAPPLGTPSLQLEHHPSMYSRWDVGADRIRRVRVPADPAGFG